MLSGVRPITYLFGCKDGQLSNSLGLQCLKRVDDRHSTVQLIVPFGCCTVITTSRKFLLCNPRILDLNIQNFSIYKRHIGDHWWGVVQVAGFKFERIGAPQPRSMAEAAAEVVLERISNIDDAVVPWFEGAAQKLLEDSGNPVTAVAKALAQATGVLLIPLHGILLGVQSSNTWCSGLRCV